MHRFVIEDSLTKTLEKMFKRDRKTYECVMSKITEIVNSPDIDHYKNLKRPLQQFKRVHIGQLVLLFRQSEDKIIFNKIDHHDKIYL